MWTYLFSLRGPVGATGPGFTGPIGPTGPQGLTGPTGATPHIEYGNGVTAKLSAGNTQDVVVTLTATMSTSTYTTKLIPTYGVAGHATLAVLSKTATTVTVRVTATSGVELGSTFMVIAVL